MIPRIRYSLGDYYHLESQRSGSASNGRLGARFESRRDEGLQSLFVEQKMLASGGCSVIVEGPSSTSEGCFYWSSESTELRMHKGVVAVAKLQL